MRPRPRPRSAFPPEMPRRTATRDPLHSCQPFQQRQKHVLGREWTKPSPKLSEGRPPGRPQIHGPRGRGPSEPWRSTQRLCTNIGRKQQAVGAAQAAKPRRAFRRSYRVKKCTPGFDRTGARSRPTKGAGAAAHYGGAPLFRQPHRFMNPLDTQESLAYLITVHAEKERP